MRILTILILFICGCAPQSEPEIPEDVRNLQNHTVLPLESEASRDIQFSQIRTFGEAGDNLIGQFGNIEVDESGRIYIGDSLQHTIHIFTSDGSYLTRVGKEGSGPGDFRAIGELTVTTNKLIVHDPLMYRLNVFSLDSIELIRTINLIPVNQREYEELNGLNLNRIIVLNNNRYLAGFSSPVYPDSSHPEYNLNDRFISYYIMDNAGMIISDKVFKKQVLQSLTATINGEFRYTAFEFMGRPIITISPEHYIFTAVTNEFLIEVRDLNGECIRAFYYPFQKQDFSRNKAIEIQEQKYEEFVSEWRVSVIQHVPEEQLPETWPALNDMLVDDEKRLWISTIVEDFDVNEWWVIEDTGNVIAKFEWPRDEPIEAVKNGYIYTRKVDEMDVVLIVQYSFRLN